MPVLWYCSPNHQTHIPDLEVTHIAVDTLNIYHKEFTEGKKRPHWPQVYQIKVKNNTDDTLYLFSSDTLRAYSSKTEYFTIKGDSILAEWFGIPNIFKITYNPVLPQTERIFLVIISPMLSENGLVSTHFKYSKFRNSRDSVMSMEAFFLCEHAIVTQIYHPPSDFKKRVYFEGQRYYPDE